MLQLQTTGQPVDRHRYRISEPRITENRENKFQLLLLTTHRQFRQIGSAKEEKTESGFVIWSFREKRTKRKKKKEIIICWIRHTQKEREKDISVAKRITKRRDPKIQWNLSIWSVRDGLEPNIGFGVVQRCVCVCVHFQANREEETKTTERKKERKKNVKINGVWEKARS